MVSSANLLQLARQVRHYELPVDGTRAARLAHENYRANRSAVRDIQPTLLGAVPEELPDWEWIFARDGSLSARLPGRAWISGSSVPRALAERALQKLEAKGLCIGFVVPAHAQDVVVALSKLAPEQTLLVVHPADSFLIQLLACHDFSADLRSRKFILAVGPAWQREFADTFTRHPTLVPPHQLIKLPYASPRFVERVFGSIEHLIHQESQSHQQKLRAMSIGMAGTSTSGLLLAAGSSPRLWSSLTGHLLSVAAANDAADVSTLDTSDPTTASAMALARAAQSKSALLTADVGRADLPELLPVSKPWIAWCSHGRIPKRVESARRDKLILSSAQLLEPALRAGWNKSDLRVGLPIEIPPIAADAKPTMIVDFVPPHVPAAFNEFSSHRLLWEFIDSQLSADALFSNSPLQQTIPSLLAKFNIDPQSFPFDLLVRQLLEPAFARALAKQLVKRGVDFRLVGSGWDSEPELTGVRSSVNCLNDALAGASCLIDMFPGQRLHRQHFVRRPVVPTWGRSWSALLRDLARPQSLPVESVPALALTDILSLAQN
jgi:hypothetical protein